MQLEVYNKICSDAVAKYLSRNVEQIYKSFGEEVTAIFSDERLFEETSIRERYRGVFERQLPMSKNQILRLFGKVWREMEMGNILFPKCGLKARILYWLRYMWQKHFLKRGTELFGTDDVIVSDKLRETLDRLENSILEISDKLDESGFFQINLFDITKFGDIMEARMLPEADEEA